MALYLKIHPNNPQLRLINQVVVVLRQGGIMVYPTDSSYALGCLVSNKAGIDRIRRIRQLDARHHMTIMCHDLSDIGIYTKLDNVIFRLIKRLTPGPYTFLLKAKRDVPKRIQHPQRKTIGIRIPDNKVASAILNALGEPLLSTSLILPTTDIPETDAEVINQRLGHVVELVVDGGACDIEATTVLDMTLNDPQVVRPGKGDVSEFLG